jgi:CRP-like cAMP-binding protein
MYFLRAGLVMLCCSDEEGQEQAVALRGPRSLLCYEALGGRPSPVEVRAVGPCRVCAVPVNRMATLLGADVSPAGAVLSLLLEEMARRDEDLAWRTGDALHRVERFLAAYGERADLLPRLPKQLIARALGIRPETLSRCLRRLSEEGARA